MKISQKVKDGLKSHIVDSTAILASTNPLFAGLETMLLGMSDEVSLNARLLATGLTYGGFGFLISKGRDLYRKLMNVNENTKESTQKFHDALYMGLFQLGIAPAFYYVAGARDLNQIIGGTLTATAFGLSSGALVGYAIDSYRNLTGIKESPRIPETIKNKSSKFKLVLAAAITAASIVLNAGVYQLTPDKKQETPKVKNNIEKVVTNYSSTQFPH